jgi:hypothetical protein
MGEAYPPSKRDRGKSTKAASVGGLLILATGLFRPLVAWPNFEFVSSPFWAVSLTPVLISGYSQSGYDRDPPSTPSR